MRALRSYHFLAAVLAVVLFSGGFLPLVGYACTQANMDRMMAECCKGHPDGMATSGAPCPHHAGRRVSAPDGKNAMTCCLLSMSTQHLPRATSAKTVVGPDRHLGPVFVLPILSVSVVERHVSETPRTDHALHPTGPPLHLLNTVFLR